MARVEADARIPVLAREMLSDLKVDDMMVEAHVLSLSANNEE